MGDEVRRGTWEHPHNTRPVQHHYLTRSLTCPAQPPITVHILSLGGAGGRREEDVREEQEGKGPFLEKDVT